MPPRQHPRRIARELALLSLSQISGKTAVLEQQEIRHLVLAAIRTLSSEVHEILEIAAEDVNLGNERLLNSGTRATSLESAKAMIQEALVNAQTAINHLGIAVQLPELLHLADQPEVKAYAIQLIATVHQQRQEVQRQLEAALVDWQYHRLARIDRDILRLAVAEILFLEVPTKVAINEAVELAKQYSDEEGPRFINGVLRRVNNLLNLNSSVAHASTTMTSTTMTSTTIKPGSVEEPQESLELKPSLDRSCPIDPSTIDE